MIKNEELISIEEIINQCTAMGIITAWHMAAIKDNPIFILTLFNLQKYNLNTLYSLTLYFDKTPDINQKIIKNHFKSLILKETALSIDNYEYHHYAAVILDTTTPSVNNSLEIVARGFKATGLEKTKHIMSILFKYLDAPLYAKLFKAVIEKEDNQSLANYDGQLLNKAYELFFGCCSISDVKKAINKPNIRDNIIKFLNKLYEEPKNKFTDLFYWMSAEDLDDTIDKITKSAELQKQSTYLDLHLEIHDIHHDSIIEPTIL
jgi:hypothetical protein